MKYFFFILNFLFHFVSIIWGVIKIEKLFHFAMIGGIFNFISFCVDSMRSVLNEKLYFALKDGTSFQSPRKHLRSKVTPNSHLTYSKMGGNLALVVKCKNDLFLHKTIFCGYSLESHCRTEIHIMILCFKGKTLLLAVYYSTIRSLSSQLVPNSDSFTRYRDIAYHVAIQWPYWRRIDGQTDRPTDKPRPICLLNFCLHYTIM